MRGIREIFSNKSIRFKWLVSYIAILISIIITLTIVDVVTFTRSISDMSNTNTIQMINQVKNNIEFYLRDLERVAAYISQDPTVRKYLKEKSITIAEKNELKKEIERLFKMYTSENTEISGLLLAIPDGSFVSADMITITRDPLTREEWYQKAIIEPDQIHLFSKPIGRNVRSIYEYYRAEDILSTAKAVKDETDQILGVILIDFKLKTIDKIISNISLGKNGFIYIADQNGEIVYTPVNKVAYRINTESFNDQKNSTIQSINGQKYQILYQYAPSFHWYVIGVFSLDETLNVIGRIQFYTAIYSGGVLLLAIFVSFLYTNSITKPISKLRRLMKEAEKGNLDVRFNPRSNDEIGQLGKSFNTMIESIKSLMNLVYVEQQKKKEAEFKTFQAQIKPHFLYNTLDTINWMAQEYRADDISKVVTALTNFFRISLSKGKEIIQIKDELKQVESYLMIQSVRYEDKFDYEIVYDPGILPYQMIKLILQPLVENAIYHGIKEKRGKGHIRIEAREMNGELHFIVEDDGVGIEPSRVQELNQCLMSGINQDGKFGIGLQNVNERIKLTYGPEYGVSIKSNYGAGTRVEIRHPIVSHQEMGDYDEKTNHRR